MKLGRCGEDQAQGQRGPPSPSPTLAGTPETMSCLSEEGTLVSRATSKTRGGGFKEFHIQKVIRVLLSSWDFLTVLWEFSVAFI